MYYNKRGNIKGNKSSTVVRPSVRPRIGVRETDFVI